MLSQRTQKEQNNNALTFALNYTQRLKKITSPLFNTFDLTTFGYKKVLKDGRYIFLSTNESWVKYHLQQIKTHGTFFASAMSQSLLTDGFYRVCWPSQATDHFLEALQHWGMWNGINFYKNHNDFIELWTFSTSPHKYQDPNAYLGILPYLERFIHYFNTAAIDVIHNNNNENVLATCLDSQTIFSNSSSLEEYPSISLFLEKTAVDQLPIFGRNGLCYLSKQESRCLKFLAKGKSAKEIGALLNLSPRTVEGYIDQIKYKLGYTSRSALIHTLNESLRLLGYKGDDF